MDVKSGGEGFSARGVLALTCYFLSRLLALPLSLSHRNPEGSWRELFTTNSLSLVACKCQSQYKGFCRWNFYVCACLCACVLVCLSGGGRLWYFLVSVDLSSDALLPYPTNPRVTEQIRGTSKTARRLQRQRLRFAAERWEGKEEEEQGTAERALVPTELYGEPVATVALREPSPDGVECFEPSAPADVLVQALRDEIHKRASLEVEVRLQPASCARPSPALTPLRVHGQGLAVARARAGE